MTAMAGSGIAASPDAQIFCRVCAGVCGGRVCACARQVQQRRSRERGMKHAGGDAEEEGVCEHKLCNVSASWTKIDGAY